MIFDDLRPGETVETIDSKRPNANLEPYRNSQLRAIAAPMRISFSSLSKNYNGTYSAQRQELVEQYGAYGVLAYEFISQMVRPVYERLIAMAVVSGELVLPRGVTWPAPSVPTTCRPPCPGLTRSKKSTHSPLKSKPGCAH
ncbi:hypothetical protein AB672_05740 [Xylella taiwanensis]|nr:hypothetical protein AB672_05740 [Xylella taiwanensis]